MEVTQRYMAELGPIPRLVVDEAPPIGVKLWLITQYGNGFAGDWQKHYTNVVAWCPLPKLTPEQKRRLLAMEASAMNPAEPEPDNPPSCCGYNR